MKYLLLITTCYLTNLSTVNKDPMITIPKSLLGTVYATGWSNGFDRGLNRPSSWNKVLKFRSIDSLNYMTNTLK